MTRRDHCVLTPCSTYWQIPLLSDLSPRSVSCRPCELVDQTEQIWNPLASSTRVIFRPISWAQSWIQKNRETSTPPPPPPPPSTSPTPSLPPTQADTFVPIPLTPAFLNSSTSRKQERTGLNYLSLKIQGLLQGRANNCGVNYEWRTVLLAPLNCPRAATAIQ